MPGFAYTDVPSQAGKVVLITGANQGLGLSLAKDFLNPARLPVEKQPAKVVLACRSRSKAEAAIREIGAVGDASRVVVHELDLGSLAKVRASAEELKRKVNKIDVLVLNAGVWPQAREQTVDGHEQAFGVCHLGHFLFTRLVWDLVLKADGGHARVVPVGSVAHEWTSMKTGEELLEDPKFEKGTWGPEENYARAKLANVLFAKELARRVGTFGRSAEQLSRPWDGRDAVKVTVVTNSPGYAASALYNEMNVNCGAKLLNSVMAAHPDNLSINTMRAATDLRLSSGCYLSPKRMNFWGPPIVKDSSKLSQSEDLAKRLWALTERIVGEKFHPAAVR